MKKRDETFLLRRLMGLMGLSESGWGHFWPRGEDGVSMTRRVRKLIDNGRGDDDHGPRSRVTVYACVSLLITEKFNFGSKSPFPLSNSENSVPKILHSV